MTYVGSKRQILPWLTYCMDEKLTQVFKRYHRSFEIWDLTIGGYNTLPMWEELIIKYSSLDKKIVRVHLSDKNMIIMSFIANYFNRLQRGESTPLSPMVVDKPTWDSLKNEWKNSNKEFISDEQKSFQLLWCAFIQSFNGKYWGSHIDFEANKDRIMSSWNKTQSQLKSFYDTCVKHNVDIMLYGGDMEDIDIRSNNNFHLIYVDPPYHMSSKDNKEFYEDWNPKQILGLKNKCYERLGDDDFCILMSEANLTYWELIQVYQEEGNPDLHLFHETYCSKSSFNKARVMYERLYEVYDVSRRYETIKKYWVTETMDDKQE